MNKLPIIIVACTLVIVAAVIISFALLKNNSGFEESSTALPELKVLSTDESGDKVDVETTYVKLSFPYAFSDIISVKAVSEDKSASLQFISNIEGEAVTIYSIHFNSDEGIPCGALSLPEYDAEISVSVVFADIPETISEDWVSTFQATQETFNDVITSMSEDDRFTYAE